MDSKYAFGVIETPGEKAKSPLPAPAYTIPYRDISAVVMDSAMVDLASMPREASARYLLRHQQVLEKVMASHPVIPMKLGTYVSSHAEAVDVLLSGYRDFKDTLSEIGDKAEFDVAAAWADLDSLIRQTAEESEDVREFKRNLASKKGGITTEDRMKAGYMVREAMKESGRKTAAVITSALAGIALAQRPHALMDDGMVLNAAFLVENGKRKRFDEALNGLDGAYRGRINFRCVGPLPAYSFYTAEIKKVGAGELDKAKKLLGFWDFPAYRHEIEKAYRRRARMCHPDAAGPAGRKGQVCPHTEIPEIEGDGESGGINGFTGINGAYKLLMECSGPGTRRREDGSVLIVRIRK
ncbi:MAG: GvpL/GvpF family gas vesicle protein [Nitrospiraceae bacterium]|nr:GvpL/GvpF family gas vesicle protein [Nitrospiraceae bacterium]